MRLTPILLTCALAGCIIPERLNPPSPVNLSEPLCADARWGDPGDEPVVPEVPAVDLEAQDFAIHYPADRTHSPINVHVARRIRAIAASNPSADPHVFIKVGDSISESSDFLACATSALGFGQEEDELRNFGGRALDDVVAHYCGAIEGDTPFARPSESTRVGQDSAWPTLGDPNPSDTTPLDRELAAANPQVAIVMYGTNDLSRGGSADPEAHRFKFEVYPGNMLRLLDTLIERGVVPILMSVPPRTDEAGFEHIGDDFNELIRGLAESRQIPFVDFYREIRTLPDQGLGGDGIHPTTYDDGACNFTEDGLQSGYNLRNLLALTALERVRRVLIEDATHLDEVSPALARALEGAGTPADPFEVDRLPYAWVNDIDDATSESIDDYGPCALSRGGPEHIYRLTVEEPTRVRAITGAHEGNERSFRLSLLSSPQGEACVVLADNVLTAFLEPGTWYFAVDTEPEAEVGPGEYLFEVHTCGPDDAACD